MQWGDYGVGSIRCANLDGSNVADKDSQLNKNNRHR